MMGHMKATLPYGTIGDELDGPIPFVTRLPAAATKPASAIVVCPVCGEDWDIAEFRPTNTHCGASTFEPGPAQARMILYWCPCGTVWAPEDAGQDGEFSWCHPTVIFTQGMTPAIERGR